MEPNKPLHSESFPLWSEGGVTQEEEWEQGNQWFVWLCGWKGCHEPVKAGGLQELDDENRCSSSVSRKEHNPADTLISNNTNIS